MLLIYYYLFKTSHHFSTLVLLFESRLRKLLKYPSSKVMNYPKIERSFLEILSIFRVLDAFLTTPTSMLSRWKILRERVKILSLNSSSSINYIKIPQVMYNFSLENLKLFLIFKFIKDFN